MDIYKPRPPRHDNWAYRVNFITVEFWTWCLYGCLHSWQFCVTILTPSHSEDRDPIIMEEGIRYLAVHAALCGLM
jgi:hypothetical protein